MAAANRVVAKVVVRVLDSERGEVPGGGGGVASPTLFQLSTRKVCGLMLDICLGRGGKKEASGTGR